MSTHAKWKMKSTRTFLYIGSRWQYGIKPKKNIFRGIHRNHTPRVGPRHPSLYSTRFLNFGHFTFLGCVFYGNQQAPLEKERNFAIMGGGQFPWCRKIGSCLLLVCPIFGYARSSEKENISRRNKKKMGGTNGPDSLS
jgi:hypothetical protein